MTRAENLIRLLSHSLEDRAAAHQFLCHPGGEECPDGCEISADPGRLAIWNALERETQGWWCECHDHPAEPTYHYAGCREA